MTVANPGVVIDLAEHHIVILIYDFAANVFGIDVTLGPAGWACQYKKQTGWDDFVHTIVLFCSEPLFDVSVKI